jgi:ribosomal protein S27E
MPEGNASYFGNESPIPYSTAKLLKKLKLDIVICKVNGGYLSNPRWADKPVKGGLFEVHYRTLVTAQELETIDQDVLYDKLVETLRFNDFDWNRIRKQKYALKHRAEGLQRFIYVCPLCGNSQSIHTRKNIIYCQHCGEIAHFNEYSLIEGLPFDNLVDWDKFQKPLIPELVKHPLFTTGTMNEVQLPSNKCKEVGKFQIVLETDRLSFINQKDQMDFKLPDIKNLTLTRKEDLSFDYGEKTYFVSFKDPMLFLDAINFQNGGKI